MTVLDIVLRLVIAGVLCGVVGFEREVRHKPAGLRTNMLIGMGTALFTIASVLIAQSSADASSVDISRIASQVLPGIGFLGAGSIIQSRGSVKGLTTAATIWMVSAIGMICGLGHYHVAIVGAVLTLIALVMMRGVKTEEEADERNPSGRGE